MRLPASSVAFAAFALVLATPFSGRAQSELWGEEGEAWTPEGVLPDFSFAGYRRGEAPLPERAPEVWVTDHGAEADSDADATAAFVEAIESNPGKCIGVPEGRFVLSDRIRLEDTGTVLQGAGSGKTVLHFTRGLQEIEPTVAYNGAGFETNDWSWSGGVMVVGKPGGWTGKKRAVIEPAAYGQTSVTVDEIDGFEVGQDVIIEARDDEAGSLTKYLYRDDMGEAEQLFGRTKVRQVVRLVAIQGKVLEFDRPLRSELRAAWSPIVQRFEPPSQDCGVEGVTIDFPSRPYRGHWMEDGLNGIEVDGMNNWVRDVVIHNSDSGVYVGGQFNTLDGVVLTADRRKEAKGMTGHHGLTADGEDNLVTRFRIETTFFHDLGLGSCAMGNVFSEGSGEDLCMDHHRFAPYQNLFTAIDLGRGTRPWVSGGSGGRGLHTASGGVFWNLDSKSRFGMPSHDFGPPGLVFVGLNAASVRKSDLKEGWHYERLRPGGFEPVNLHQAQLQRRLKATGGTRPATTDRVVHEWTNVSGATIKAEFLGFSGAAVKLRMSDGKVYDYPLEKLTPSSQGLAKRLAGE